MMTTTELPNVQSRKEIQSLVREAIASLSTLPPRIRKEILESDGWVDLLQTESEQLDRRLDEYFDWCDGKRDERAGELLEEIGFLLFKTIVGVGNIRSFQSYAPQHDLVVEGVSHNWRLLMQYLHLPESGRTIVVECKNQTNKVTDQQFSRLCGILQNKFADTAHLGVFISRTPATGFAHAENISSRSLRDARATQALFHAKTGKYVIVVDHRNLEQIKQGMPFVRILEAKIREVEASSGLDLTFTENWKEVLLPKHLRQYES